MSSTPMPALVTSRTSSAAWAVLPSFTVATTWPVLPVLWPTLTRKASQSGPNSSHLSLRQLYSCNIVL
jgi:hypothetical protein